MKDEAQLNPELHEHTNQKKHTQKSIHQKRGGVPEQVRMVPVQNEGSPNSDCFWLAALLRLCVGERERMHTLCPPSSNK